MKKSSFLIFFAYVWTKTLLGLSFHPLMTVRQVTRRPVLFPVIFSPIIGLAAFFVFGRVGAFLLDFYGLRREVIAIFLSTTLISLLFWQVLLIYLFVSFTIAYLRK